MILLLLKQIALLCAYFTVILHLKTFRFLPVNALVERNVQTYKNIKLTLLLTPIKTAEIQRGNFCCYEHHDWSHCNAQLFDLQEHFDARRIKVSRKTVPIKLRC
jgi:hypothetical protein